MRIQFDPLMRPATTSDLDAIRQLDATCFPSDNPDLEGAKAGELEAAIEAGEITVSVIAHGVAAFIHISHPSPRHIYLTALAVDPKFQGNGIGGLLIDNFLLSLRDRDLESASLTTVTSPRNVAMLRLLLSKGFLARSLLADYFGPGKDRFYCQFRGDKLRLHPDDRLLMPVESMAQIQELLKSDAYSVTDVIALGPSFGYEVSRLVEDDQVALRSGEYQASVGFSSAILGGVTFLLAFAFTSSHYPSGASVLLMLATLSATASLVVYANASGALARFQERNFERFMHLGNVLSEFGGIVPFLYALNLTFSSINDNYIATGLIAGVFALALATYELSGYSVQSRIARDWKSNILVATTALLIPLGALAAATKTAVSLWTIGAVALLCLRAFAALRT